MDFVTPIIDIVSRVMSCSTKHVDYLRGLEGNLNQLQEKMEQLNEIKSDINNRVLAAEARLMVRTSQVSGWMQSVDARRNEVEEILQEGRQHLEKRCLNGCCPKNCWSSYKLGKQVAKYLLDMEKLLGRGVFPVVALTPPPSRVQELQAENFTVGLELELERALNLLSKDGVKILGFYGVGGVGKTTFLKKINNELKKRNNHDFDIVIWVVISSVVNIGGVQKDICKRLGLEEYWSDRVSSSANVIYNALNTKKFLMFLDDVWQEIDLQSIGIPLPSAENKSKIVLSTRSLDVCGAMGADENIKVESLNKEQSLILFKEKVGQKTLTADPEIPKLAEKIVEKCDGLPLALITIGASMASKTNPREWQRAISDLNKCAAKFPAMEQRVLPLLKFSYDKLPSPTEQVCFLFCALYSEDYLNYIASLIEQWIGVGYIGGLEDYEEALNIGHSIIGTLMRACLLENGMRDEVVKMHDVIRELALWIVRECGREEGKVFVNSNFTLTELPLTAICPPVVQKISLQQTTITHLENLPKCPNLSIFFAPYNNHLTHINDDFFLSMPALKFLDLSSSEITKLPTSICELFELEFLNLSRTKIKTLPYELRNLTKLKYLSFIGTELLCIIPRGMMMHFSNLEILELEVPKSGDSDEEMQVDIDELRYLNKLKALSISTSNLKDLGKLFSNPRLCNCTRLLVVKACKEIIFPTLSSRLSPGHFKQLSCLYICYSSELKEWIFDCSTNETEIELFESMETMRLVNLPNLIISWDARNLHCPYFRKLQKIELWRCDAMVDLTWLLLIPNLQTLLIQSCGSLLEILSSAESGSVYDQNAFSNLKSLTLWELPNLHAICSMCPLHLPSLETINVVMCPKLRRLPLDLNSAKNTLKKIQGGAKWWNGLEWENETIKTQLAKFFSHVDISEVF